MVGKLLDRKASSVVHIHDDRHTFLRRAHNLDDRIHHSRDGPHKLLHDKGFRSHHILDEHRRDKALGKHKDNHRLSFFSLDTLGSIVYRYAGEYLVHI